jgi:hypothetical protein
VLSRLRASKGSLVLLPTKAARAPAPGRVTPRHRPGTRGPGGKRRGPSLHRQPYVKELSWCPLTPPSTVPPTMPPVCGAGRHAPLLRLLNLAAGGKKGGGGGGGIRGGAPPPRGGIAAVEPPRRGVTGARETSRWAARREKRAGGRRHRGEERRSMELQSSLLAEPATCHRNVG